MGLIHEKLTYVIRKCIWDIHNTIGTGFDEETYHRMMFSRLEKENIPIRSKETRKLMHRDEEIKEFELDLLVDDKVILELKSLQSKFLQANYVQIITHLKLWQKQLGLLVNFGLVDANIERIPFSEKDKEITENYDYIKDLITHADRELLEKLRGAILSVFETHGLGYGESICQSMVEAELRHRKIPFQAKTMIPIEFEGRVIHKFELNLPLIEDRIICCVTAIHERVDYYDIARMRSYMKALKLPFGLLVNFGKHELEIRGVRG